MFWRSSRFSRVCTVDLPSSLITLMPFVSTSGIEGGMLRLIILDRHCLSEGFTPVKVSLIIIGCWLVYRVKNEKGNEKKPEANNRYVTPREEPPAKWWIIPQPKDFPLETPPLLISGQIPGEEIRIFYQNTIEEHWHSFRLPQNTKNLHPPSKTTRLSCEICGGACCCWICCTHFSASAASAVVSTAVLLFLLFEVVVDRFTSGGPLHSWSSKAFFVRNTSRHFPQNFVFELFTATPHLLKWLTQPVDGGEMSDFHSKVYPKNNIHQVFHRMFF